MIRPKIIGLISDTHGHLSSKALEVLKGVDLILHAGDIGTDDVLQSLKNLAPTEAVKGNMDYGQLAANLPSSTMIEIAKHYFYLIHDKEKLDLDPYAAGVHAVVFGHTHKSCVERIGGIWYINPGSATHPRYGENPTLALVEIRPQSVLARIIKI